MSIVRWIGLSSVLLSVLLVSCMDKTPAPPLKISLDVWPGYAYIFIAQEKGLFEKYGVNVDLVLKPTPVEAKQLFDNKEVDGRLCVFSDVLVADMQGISAKAVYMADYSNTGDVIVGRANMKSLADLKGKIIAFDGIETFSHMFVVGSLEKAGVHLGEYKAVNLPVQDVSNALEAGTIDAGHTWEPTTTEALTKGYKILAKAGDIPGIVTDVLAFHTDVIEKRAEDIHNVVRALVEARNFFAEHQEEAIKIMARKMNMSEASMKEGITGVHNPDLKENIAAMQSGGALFQSGEIAVQFYMDRGKLFKKTEIGTYIDTLFVSSAR